MSSSPCSVSSSPRHQRIVLVGWEGAKLYHVMWSADVLTAPALLLHLGFLPDVFHVFVMGPNRPVPGSVGALVTDDSVNLWGFNDGNVRRMIVRLERLPLDDDDLKALLSDCMFQLHNSMAACSHVSPMASRLRHRFPPRCYALWCS